MHNEESYVGDISLKNVKTMDAFFDKDIRTNLNNITELVLNIFDARASSIVMQTPQKPVELCQHGSEITLTKDDLLSDILTEIVIESESLGTSGDSLNANLKTFKVVLPIFLPSNLKFGWLVFERKSNSLLTKKETKILNTLQKNIVTQLAQRNTLFEQAKDLAFHSTISKLNRDFIFIKDEDFKFIYINDAFKSVYPKKMQNKIIGFTTLENYDDEEAKIFLAQDQIALDCGISKIVENLHFPNGSHIIVETIKQRFEDDFGKRYILGVCRDITEKENLIIKLQKANSELDEFTSIASHDLKSPLNAIKRLLEWISDDCKHLLPKEHLENFQLVINRTNRMQVLLQDLLSYSKINSCDSTVSNLSLEKTYRDIAEILEIPETVTAVINANNTLLNLPTLPFKIVFQHIICNAIKHNNKEHRVINISLLPSDHYYIIEITDNGPGIDPKYFSLIFKLFQTLQSRDDVEGSGIGLCVAKKIITNYGGKIEVTSDGMLGSTFTLYWPKI